MLSTKGIFWSCEPEPDGECTVVITCAEDTARVSTKGRPSFQTVADSVYTIIECYSDYFYSLESVK
jgi:hypothetical protein